MPIKTTYLQDQLMTEDDEFQKVVAMLPADYWTKYDISACRIGWELRKIADQVLAEPEPQK